MFLLSNLARTGLDVDEGKPFQATYAGAFRGDELVGVAASCWNGMVLVQAPTGLRPLAVAVQSQTRHQATLAQRDPQAHVFPRTS